MTAVHHIDPYMFERQLDAFKRFVEQKSGVTFVSFASHPYVQGQEGYKNRIYQEGRAALSFESWKQSDIGTGRIASAAIRAIEIPGSNLVAWQPTYGEESRPQQPLYEAVTDPVQLGRIEKCVYSVYRDQADASSFEQLIGIFGKSYPVIAYLFFLKDRSKYLPIAPTFFDRAFGYLGVSFKTSHQCSWQNYATYVGLIAELKTLLMESLGSEVSLLDSHSYAWMLAAQMEKEKALADLTEYLSLSDTERSAIVKARIGQGRFREALIDYWSTCAVTGCAVLPLLRASHIKPWKVASFDERLSVYNGLLLNPTLDACFDSGFISFGDDGKILISSRINGSEASILGIHPEMRLKRIEDQHRLHLKFHREQVFVHM